MPDKAQTFIRVLWPSFFPKETFCDSDIRMNVISIFRDLFESEHGKALLQDTGVDLARCSDLDLRISDLAAMLPAGDFVDMLRSRPSEMIGSIGIALSLCVTLCYPLVEEPFVIFPHLYGLDPLTSFGELRSSTVGQLVAVKGYVLKVTACKPLVLRANFHCGLCEKDMTISLEDGVMMPPERCWTPKCRGKYFELQRHSVVASDYQRVKLQELESYEEDIARVPRTFDIELRGNLVDCCISGDCIDIVGIVKTFQAAKSYARNTEAGLHQLYVLANSVAKSTTSTTKVIQSIGQKRPRDTSGRDSSDVDFSAEVLQDIQSIAQTKGCLGLLCASVCPGIFGHELVKVGLLLGLLGGSRPKDEADASESNIGNMTFSAVQNGEMCIRSDIHVLVVGDPGLGKSQMLRAAAALSPRAIFVCANTTTTAGLTVAVSREGSKGDVNIEAGALVLADRGVCCIDELDKMSSDPHSLLEAMEQQQISIAKSGVVTSLKSRCSILAAANPVGGHYNRKKSVGENLKMASALLSRFDLVFILVDKPDASHDKLISEHIIKTHSLAKGKVHTQPHESLSSSSSQGLVGNIAELETLSQRLRRETSQFCNRTIDVEIFRKYIAYARKYVHPVLTPAAAKVLQKLYLTMRSQSSLGESIPVTTRHLESLIRLSQARARAELRDEVTEDDANDVVFLLQESLLDAFTNETGAIDIGRRGGMSLAKQVKALVKFLTQEAKVRGSSIFSKKDIEEAIIKLRFEKAHDVNALIDVMRTECYLLLKGPKMYQIIESS